MKKKFFDSGQAAKNEAKNKAANITYSWRSSYKE